MHHKTLQSLLQAIVDYSGETPHLYVVNQLKALSPDAVLDLQEARREDRAEARESEVFGDACVWEMVELLHLESPDDLSRPLDTLASYFNEDLEERNMKTRVSVRPLGADEYWYIRLAPDEETWVQDRLNTTYAGVAYLFDVQEMHDVS